MVREWQSHSGAVNTSTTPSVQYGRYSEMASGANHSRLTFGHVPVRLRVDIQLRVGDKMMSSGCRAERLDGPHWKRTRTWGLQPWWSARTHNRTWT